MPMTSLKASPHDSPRQGRLRCAAALVLAMIAAIVPATAQFPAAPDDAGRAPRARRAPPPAPAVNGNWTGELTQVGSPTPYKFELTINAKGAETKYPDLDCIGQAHPLRLVEDPMPSSSKSSPRARRTKADAAPTAP